MNQLNSKRRPRRRMRRFGGFKSFELVLALPILLIMTVAAVQFGLLFANLEQVALASRIGAIAASQDPAVAMSQNADPVPPSILDRITRQLQSSDIQWCKVRLEHNVGGTPLVLESFQGDPCECGPTTTLTSPPHDDESYVRVTVCVRLTELMPDSLTFFGVSVDNKVTGSTTTMQIEP